MENQIISPQFLIEAFRHLNPENQKIVIDSLRVLVSSSGQMSDFDDSEQKKK